MAETKPPADMASAAGSSSDSTHSMQSLLALQPRISDPSLRIHRVQAWLVSNSVTRDSVFPEDLATSEGEHGAASEGHACAAPAHQSAENATAVKSIMAEQHEAVAASEQPESLHQLSSDQCTTVQQAKASAEQSASSTVGGAASQQAAAAAMRQSAVQALVQRFEHMTVARLKTSKPADKGPGLLALSLSDKAPQQRPSEVKIPAVPERGIDVAVMDDESHSDSGSSVTPSRQLQSSPPAAEEEAGDRLHPAASDGTPLLDHPSICQPPEWHTNTAFELESSSDEQAKFDSAVVRCADLTTLGASGVAQAPAHLWPEGLAVPADVKEDSVQRSGEAGHRYAVMTHAPATDDDAYCFCHCYCHCCCNYCFHFLCCMCIVKQGIASW